jgi:sugar lactone lactonase YvrE
MSDATIKSIFPKIAIPGGEIELHTEGLLVEPGATVRCFVNGVRAHVSGASSRRVVAVMPEIDDSTAIVQIEAGGSETSGFIVTAGKLLANEMHIVANPAIDPADDALILTRSGSRGQSLANTLYRLETDGYLDELPVEMMNPTGIAVGPTGTMYATNRSDGTVCRIDRGETAVVVASDLGVATGIAFGPDGTMFVGDRSGTIYRVFEDGGKEEFATLEPSVAAFHIAFGPDGKLYVSSPGFASHDIIYAVDVDGGVEPFVRGLGRPQGLAFDRDGNLYVAACHKGRHGVVRIAAETREIEHFIAGNSVVGLCFTRNGELIVATGDSAYSLNLGIYGTLV